MMLASLSHYSSQQKKSSERIQYAYKVMQNIVKTYLFQTWVKSAMLLLNRMYHCWMKRSQLWKYVTHCVQMCELYECIEVFILKIQVKIRELCVFTLNKYRNIRVCKHHHNHMKFIMKILWRRFRKKEELEEWEKMKYNPVINSVVITLPV